MTVEAQFETEEKNVPYSALVFMQQERFAEKLGDGPLLNRFSSDYLCVGEVPLWRLSFAEKPVQPPEDDVYSFLPYPGHVPERMWQGLGISERDGLKVERELIIDRNCAPALVERIYVMAETNRQSLRVVTGVVESLFGNLHRSATYLEGDMNKEFSIGGGLEEFIEGLRMPLRGDAADVRTFLRIERLLAFPPFRDRN